MKTDNLMSTLTRYIDKRINERYANQKTKQDAFYSLCKFGWDSWTPTFNWTGTTPSGITTSAKYWKIAKTIFFAIDFTTTDGNGATNVTIDTPENCNADSIRQLFTACQIVDGVYQNNIESWLYSNSSTAKIEFRNLATFANGLTTYLFVSGCYEVA